MDYGHTKLSYLYARDPSIISCYKPLENVKKDLKPDLMEVSNKQEDDNHIQVYLRIKKGDLHFYKIKNNILSCTIPEGSHVLRNVKENDRVEKTYTFSRIFGPETTQQDIFNNIIKQKMLSFINGNNVTLLTYGASGAGKTFTVVGTAQEPGLIPRALEYLFRTIPDSSNLSLIKPTPEGRVIKINDIQFKHEIQAMHNLLNNSAILSDKATHIRTYKQMQQRLTNEPVAEIETSTSNISLAVWVSFAEIYNECIYDLLQTIDKNGKKENLRLGNSKGHIYIKNLTSINVRSGMDAYKILQYGIQNLNYAATKINSHSSRSHSIFTIKLVQYSEDDGGSHISYFNFCDLAGSERMKKSLNVGDRLKESNNINTSLLVLGKCINLVRNSQKNSNDQQTLVPFRESKLTQLFQRALSGQETITMIVNINPSRDMFDETHHVLNFSAIAKDISIIRKPIVNNVKKNNRFSQYLERSVDENNPQFDDKDDIIEESDVEILRNKIIELQEELDLVKAEGEQNEQLTRVHVTNCYKRILENKELFWQQKMESLKNRLETEFEMKLQELKNHYEKEVVINLDDSEDEADVKEKNKQELEEFRMLNATIKSQNEKIIADLEYDLNIMKSHKELLEKKCCDQQQELEVLKATFNSQTENMSRLEYDLSIMKHDKELLEKKCYDLNVTLDDGVEYVKELNESTKVNDTELNNLKIANIKLLEKIEELEISNHGMLVELDSRDKEIMELEEKLSNFDIELFRLKLEDEIQDSKMNENGIICGNEATDLSEYSKDSVFSHTDRNFSF